MVFITCFAKYSFSQKKTIEYLDTNISIDGKLDESVWDNCQLILVFIITHQTMKDWLNNRPK